MRMGDADRATQHARRATLLRRLAALPAPRHSSYIIPSAWLFVLMAHTWSRVCAHLVCTPVNAVCQESTARHVSQGSICRVVIVEPPALRGKDQGVTEIVGSNPT
jgi:hypothetical protein